MSTENAYLCHRRSWPQWMTVEEAAEVLRVDTKTVRRRIRAGKIPISPHGKPYRVDRDGMFYRARSAKTELQNGKEDER